MSKHHCAECGREISRPNARYCSASCKRDYNNRRCKRGAVLVDLMIARIQDRAEAREVKLISQIDRLVTSWVEEDERAGRSPADWRGYLAANPWLRAHHHPNMKIGRST